MKSKSFADFNKEILFGFIGAIIGAPTLSYIVSIFTASTTFIPASAVAGDIIGGGILWAGTRMYYKNEKEKEKYSFKKLAGDVAYFTPVAFIISILVSYPTIFLLSKHLLNDGVKTVTSVVLSQGAAFLLFITLMNLYRLFLIKILGKRL